jgi:hypothetical protein
MPGRGTIIAAGAVLSAGLVVLGSVSGPLGLLTAYFASLPLFVTGFAAGRQACLIAIAGAAAVIAATLGFEDAIMFLAAQAAPAGLVVWLALKPPVLAEDEVEWVWLGTVLAWLACYGVIVFMLLAAAFLEDGSSQGLEAGLADGLEHMVMQLATGADQDRVRAVTAALARYFPAIVLASWLVMTAINAIMGFRLAQRFFGPKRPEPAWSAMWLPGWLMTVIAAASLLALIGKGTTVGFVGGNAALALCVPYVFLGFATAHVLAARLGPRRFVLWGLYVAVFLLGWPVLLVAILGFVEDWIGVRRRYAVIRPEDRT